MRIVIYHGGYGCDTGCCGHYIKVDGEEKLGSFQFDHPYGGDKLAWAKQFVAEQFGEEHVADLDWDNCIVTDDC